MRRPQFDITPLVTGVVAALVALDVPLAAVAVALVLLALLALLAYWEGMTWAVREARRG